MQLIDHTPYLSKDGEISLTNQIRAAFKYGLDWYPEIKAQNGVIAYFNSNLTKGYTLLHNIVLPGSQATIPLILVGPAGVSVIMVTNLKGTYQAKGDSWDVIEGRKAKAARSNLLLLTSKMALAVNHYFKKQGLIVVDVEGVLICADPGMHVESARPIVRVVMRDAIEHFIVSINHASPSLTPVKSQTIVNVLMDPLFSPTSAPAINETSAKPAVSLEEIPSLSDVLPWTGDTLDFEFEEDDSQDLDRPFSNAPEPMVDPSIALQEELPPNPRPYYFDKNQWILLIIFGVVEITILLVFFWLVISNS